MFGGRFLYENSSRTCMVSFFLNSYMVRGFLLLIFRKTQGKSHQSFLGIVLRMDSGVVK